MNSNPPGPVSSRRAVVAGTMLGLLAGGGWVAGLRAVTSPSHARLAAIGDRSAQLLLLDSSRSRTLIVLGTPDDRLLDQVPALMTIFRQRIDIAIGSAMGLAALGGDFRARWNVALAAPVGVPAPVSPAATRQHPIIANTDLDLGDGLSLCVSVTSRNAWSNAAVATSLWIAEIRVHGYRIAVAPDVAGLRLLADPHPALALVPVANPSAIARQLFPASIAVNHDGDRTELDNATPDATLVRIYPEDIAVFDLREGGVGLPAWAEAPG